MISLADFKTI